MATVLTKLASVMPKIYDKLQDVQLVDTMNIVRKSASAGTGGGRIKGSATNTFTSVPVDIELRTNNRRIVQGDKPLSSVEYYLTFPVNTVAGTRITVKPETDRLVIAARGTEPAKTFRIISAPDDRGIFWVCQCEKED